jgi:hypothetical protein
MTGIPSSDELPEALESLLTMAEYELGVESQIRQLLRKQVAVHSSAMLREEQRASELAFESGLAVTLFATATLGQGLNLPANAVVIAGTEIGYDRTATASEKTARAQNQFLNAIGRAGRAQVAARSMAIVLPNKPVILSDTSSGKVLPQSADFLRHDDASTEIHSQLESLMKSAVEGQIDFDAITPAEAAAFAFLSFSSDRESAGKVLAKSFAAFRSDALNSGIDVAAALGELGQAFIDREGAPEWIAVAAHRAGVTVQRAILLERAIRGTPPPGEVPTSIDAWIEVLILILRSVPLDSLDVVLPRSAFQSTPLASAWSERDSAEGWKSFHFSLGRWVSGRTYADILTTNTQATSSGRGQQDPVPRVIRMIDKGFSHELSMVAGAFLSIVETSIESRDPSAWQLSQPSMHALEQLPTAIRLGVDSDASLAWLQLGFRPRRVARLMTQLFPAPDSLTPAELRRWIRTKSSAIRLQDLEGILDAKDRRVISAVVSTRTYVDPLP